MIVLTVSARFAIAAHATELPDGASSGETCRENAKQRPILIAVLAKARTHYPK